MRLLTTVLSCLLSLFGCQERPSTTSITRVVDGRAELLFSKTIVGDGIATFECFASASGGCHYRLWEEACVPGAGDACPRRELDSFDLQVGRRHQVQGLPSGFRHCVTMGGQARCAG